MLATKLQDKVCEHANVAASRLPDEARQWLSEKVSKWVTSRSVSDLELRKAAAQLRKLFRDLPLRRAESAAKALTDTKNLIIADGTTNDIRSATTEPNTNSLIPISQGPLRPQVLKRLQRLTADADFNQAIEQEALALREEEAENCRRKKAEQEAMRNEMDRALRIKATKDAMEREEKRLAHQQMEEIIHEAKQIELDQKMMKVKKSRDERRAIEEQTASNQRRLEEQKQHQAAELQKLAKYNESKEKERMLRDLEKSLAVKAALVSALEEGQSAARTKHSRTLKEPVPVFDTRAFATDSVATRVQKREFLQSLASQQYEELAKAKKQQLEQVDHAIMEQRMKQLEEAESREKRDKERELQLRSQLVSSLDLELSAQRDRKKRDEEEKRQQRRLIDERATEDKLKQREMLMEEKRKQRERRLQMDAQLAGRMERLISPLLIKI